MSTSDTLSGRQIAAARVLVSLTQASLAEASGMSVTSLKRMEANSVNVPASSLPCKVTAVRHALERAGAVFVAEDAAAGLGAGVRLKFTRTETRQIDNWEGEGGKVADDDVQ